MEEEWAVEWDSWVEGGWAYEDCVGEYTCMCVCVNQKRNIDTVHES